MKSSLDKDWTEGNIIVNLMMISWPVIVSQSLNMMGPTIDLIWVGRLGETAIAGVGVSGMAVMFVMSAMMGLSQGTRALVARSVGSGDMLEAKNVAIQSFNICAGYSILMVTVGILFSEKILMILGVHSDVILVGAMYMRIMFIGSALRSSRMMTESIMQASGDAIMPMKIGFVFRAIHILICPFLIFGWWISPRMGVSGAAMANVISQGIGFFIGIKILFGVGTRVSLRMSDFKLDFNMMWRIIRIGIPASVMGMQRGLSQLLVMALVVPFGTVAVAAHTILQRIEMVMAMVCMGLGIGSGTLAGQNLGAQKPLRAEKSGFYACGMAEIIMISSSTLLLIFPEHVIRMFGSDPLLVETSSIFLKIAVAGFIFMGLGPVFMQFFSGAGDTMFPMLVSLINTWIVLLPAAYLMSKFSNMGVLGIRWAMSVSMILPGIAYILHFKFGKWKETIV
jgi:putative MATE family efflux protein